MNIPIMPPPRELPPEAQRWLQELQNNMFGAIKELEEQVKELKARLP